MICRATAVALALLGAIQVPASVCEICMQRCTTHHAGDTYSESYGTNTFTYTVTAVSSARKCGGFQLFSYCSGDSATVICESRMQTTTDANGHVSGPYANDLYVNPCH